MLYKLVLVTYPLDHSRRIYSPSNFRFGQKTKKIKFVPITIIILPKINLEHLELLSPEASGASDPAPWRPKVNITVTLTHSVTKMQLT